MGAYGMLGSLVSTVANRKKKAKAGSTRKRQTRPPAASPPRAKARTGGKTAPKPGVIGIMGPAGQTDTPKPKKIVKKPNQRMKKGRGVIM